VPRLGFDAIGVVLLQKVGLELDDVLVELGVQGGKKIEHLAGKDQLGVGGHGA